MNENLGKEIEKSTVQGNQNLETENGNKSVQGSARTSFRRAANQLSFVSNASPVGAMEKRKRLTRRNENKKQNKARTPKRGDDLCSGQLEPRLVRQTKPLVRVVRESRLERAENKWSVKRNAFTVRAKRNLNRNHGNQKTKIKI